MAMEHVATFTQIWRERCKFDPIDDRSYLEAAEARKAIEAKHNTIAPCGGSDVCASHA